MGIFSKKKSVEEKDSLPKESAKELTVEEIANSGKKEKKHSVKANIVKSDTKDAYKVLVKPLISEKAAHLKLQNKYLFQVSSSTTKNEIKKAIFHVYGVWPIEVNVINIKGKKVRYGKSSGTTKDKKKAIITLKSGDSMEVYEGV